MSAIRQSGAPFDVVAIVASAGGLAAVGDVLGALPAGFPAGVIVVQHRLPRPDHCVELLRRRCVLPVGSVRAGEPPLPGHVRVAPAEGQTVVDDAGRLAIVGDGPGRGDSLLTSAAAHYGERAIGVVLTGRGSDGAAGVRALKLALGRVVVQDLDAFAPSMPQSAAATGCADFVLPLRVIGRALTALAMAPGGAELFRVRAPAWASLSPAG